MVLKYYCLGEISGGRSTKHLDTVNCLAFSHNGSLLASADDNGALLVHEIESDVIKTIHSFHLPSPITALLWCADDAGIYVGLSNGYLHLVSLNNSTTSISTNLAPTGAVQDPDSAEPFQVNCLAQDVNGASLAAGVGSTLVVLRSQGTAESSITEVLSLSFDDEAVNSVCSFEVRSLHFMKNCRHVIVTHLEQGVRCIDALSGGQVWAFQPRSYRLGRSIVDSEDRYLIASNLYDGFDVYDISRSDLQYLYTITTPIESSRNVPLPLCLIHRQQHIVLGATKGDVYIASLDSGEVLETLDHDSDIIQALDYAMIGTKHYIATACAEKGPSTYVKLWCLNPDPLAPLEDLQIIPDAESDSEENLDTEYSDISGSESEAVVRDRPPANSAGTDSRQQHSPRTKPSRPPLPAIPLSGRLVERRLVEPRPSSLAFPLSGAFSIGGIALILIGIAMSVAKSEGNK
ncbi:hypothetical protein CC2G_004346 [Coprinopsis cinerea AmutBmut pab1-1]|nr:hypothetical protein CC2G_004346 [Coprinopsis cinerea AmutBmut pab1-1]